MPTISVYTPSHEPRYLDQCWESLVSQSYEDFEWIVVLNHGATWEKPDDPRIRVLTSARNGVGALKSDACKEARGEILVELDHDDLLAVTALEDVAFAFGENPDAGFVYSDAAQVNEDLTRNEERFADGYGWTYRDEAVQVGDAIYTPMVCESKPPTPHNVSYIWYAPNHLRAFRTSVYEAIGGYDAMLEVCDDADIICRMYQAAPFVHIPRCLYLQRLGNNTQRIPATNAKIQAETVRIYDENVQRNALVWAERESLTCLDLGGAHDAPEGYYVVDKAAKPGPLTIVGDAIEVLGEMMDDSIGVIRAVDFLEHVADKVTLMNEIYRVLAPGGMLLSLTPSTDGRGAFCDPTHVAYWNELSFRYYCSDSNFVKYVPEVTARFRQSRLVTYFPSPWHEENLLSYVLFNGSKEP